MASRARRTVARASRQRETLIGMADDRKTEIAAGALGTAAVAGAAVAGKAALERLREDGDGPSRAYRLRSKEKPKQGIRRIARGRAEDALEQLERGGEGAVHEARKDLKKLRSLLRLVRHDIGDRFYRGENMRFRDAGRRLSSARDAEVKLETLDALQERFPEEIDEDAVKGFRSVLKEERVAAADAVQADTGPAAEAVEAIKLGRNRITGWKLGTQSWEIVGPGIERSYRRGRRRMKGVRADPSAENVHEWRKRSKDLWYQLRILRDAWPEVLGSTADQVHELSDLLGDHHDLEVLAADARDRRDLFGEAKEARTLAKLAARRQGELLREALDLGTRLYAEKPKAFERRLEAYWLSWRPA
jgi:CHAD domain-containing protein